MITRALDGETFRIPRKEEWRCAVLIIRRFFFLIRRIRVSLSEPILLGHTKFRPVRSSQGGIQMEEGRDHRLLKNR